MADTNEMGTEESAELRGCAYCGEQILPGSWRCPSCAGNVALAWGTAHKEHFLFLFASILFLVGVLASWTQRFPTGATVTVSKMVEAPAVPAAPDAPAPDPKAPKKMIELKTEVAPTVEPIQGLGTIRGSLLFAIALYGVIVALFNLFYKRMVVWPFFLGSILALEIGLKGISGSIGSTAWELWKKRVESDAGGFIDKLIGHWRAIPAGYLLLTIAGALVMISLIKGVVGGFASASAKQKDKQAALAEASEARRKAREEKKPGDASAGGASS
jgi:hypothetical protein